MYLTESEIEEIVNKWSNVDNYDSDISDTVFIENDHDLIADVATEVTNISSNSQFFLLKSNFQWIH